MRDGWRSRPPVTVAAASNRRSGQMAWTAVSVVANNGGQVAGRAARRLASGQQFAAQDGDRLTGQHDPVAADDDPDEAAALGGLPRRERIPVESASPVGAQAAVCGAGT